MCEWGWRQRLGALALLLMMIGSGGCTTFHSGTPVEGSCAELMRYWSHITTFGGGGVASLIDPGILGIDSVRGLIVVRLDSLYDSTIEKDSTYYEFRKGWLQKRSKHFIRDTASFWDRSLTTSWRYDSAACRVLIDSTIVDYKGEVKRFFDTISIDRDEARFLKGMRKDNPRRLRSNDGSLIYSFDVGWMDYEGARIFDSAMRLGCEITTSDGETISIGKREGDIYIYCDGEDESGHSPTLERLDVYRVADGVVELYAYGCMGILFEKDENCPDLDSLRYLFLAENLTSRCDDITFDLRALADLVISKRSTCSCLLYSTYRYEWVR